MKVTIRDVGVLGDGIGDHQGQSVFVPFTLPGEIAATEGAPPHLTLISVDKKSPNRVEPPCPHFGTCGGCAVQHWASAPYLTWKRQILVEALKAANIKTRVGDCVPCAIESRRRATFSVRREDDGLTFGFHERDSDALVNLSTCSVLHPEIQNALQQIAKLCPVLMRGRETVQVLVTRCDNGLDLAFTLEQMPSEAMEADFVRAFSKTSFLRASVNGDLLVEREKPIVSFDDIAVPVASGSFLQSVPQIETAMAKSVISHLGKSKKILDLFSGSGTFSLRLAKKSHVHAVESDASALAALTSGTSNSNLKPVSTEQRDLFDAPLTVKELEQFDAICLDPPRAGASAQIAKIAEAKIAKVAYVSCNPTSLARDLGVLTKAGFQIDNITPYDQFLWSPHVETLALLSNPNAKKTRPIFGRKV